MLAAGRGRRLVWASISAGRPRCRAPSRESTTTRGAAQSPAKETRERWTLDAEAAVAAGAPPAPPKEAGQPPAELQ